MSKNQKNVISLAVSVLLVICFAVICLWERPKEEYDIVFLGDSVVGNAWYEPTCVSVVSERTGMKIFNGAFGGTAMSGVESEAGVKEPALWSMVKLTKAICHDDWKAQKASMAYADHYRDVNTQALFFFKERMDQLSRVDFSKVKILIITHGTNDYNNGNPLDNPKDPFDESTFGGALRSSLKLLQEHYPDLRIILMTPVYCEIGKQGELKSHNTSFGGGTLGEYVAKEMEIATEYGVEILDAYHESGIWEENIEEYLFDYLHPNDAGNTLLGNFVADYLLETR